MSTTVSTKTVALLSQGATLFPTAIDVVEFYEEGLYRVSTYIETANAQPLIVEPYFYWKDDVADQSAVLTPLNFSFGSGGSGDGQIFSPFLIHAVASSTLSVSFFPSTGNLTPPPEPFNAYFVVEKLG